MEGYGKVQYSQALPVFPICAMQLHRSTSEQKQIHTRSIAIGHDKKTGFPSQRLDRTIGIPVFPNMVTWNAGSDAFFAPAVLGMVDAAEARLILEHKAHFSTAPVEIFQFTDGGFNFFEVSMTSSLAFLGCLLRGMTFLQPCRCRT